MASLSVVFGKVRTIDDGLDGLATAAVTASGLLSNVIRLTATSARLADALDDARDALTLLSTAENVLKSVPFGIGTAVNFFENATSSMRTTLGTYATTTGRFDKVLEPVTNAVPNFGVALDILGTMAIAMRTGFELVTKDDRLLEQSFGDDPALQPFTRLSTNLVTTEDALDDYLDVRDAFGGVLEPLLDELATAVNTVPAPFPSIGFAEDLDATLNAI